MRISKEIHAIPVLITPDQLRRAMPGCPDPEKWSEALNVAIDEFDIGDDIAMFIANVGHESQDLSQLEESLWYSADRLMAVWPSRFRTYDRAQRFAGNPEALANEVYSGRMGNTQPGDGWRFRGQGPIMLTGRENYQRFANAIDDERPIRDPSCLQEPEYGALSAAWYWTERVTPGGTVEKNRREVNGGLHGLGDVRRRFNIAANIWGDS